MQRENGAFIAPVEYSVTYDAQGDLTLTSGVHLVKGRRSADSSLFLGSVQIEMMSIECAKETCSLVVRDCRVSKNTLLPHCVLAVWTHI